MEKIEGHNLYSKMFLDRLSRELFPEDITYLSTRSDAQVREFIKTRTQQDDAYMNMMIEDYS